jgi:hypothetical protein
MSCLRPAISLSGGLKRPIFGIVWRERRSMLPCGIGARPGCSLPQATVRLIDLGKGASLAHEHNWS